MDAHERCRHLQHLVHDCLAKHLYGSAVFFADKLASFSGMSVVEVYTLAQAYFMDRQYRRALHVLRTTGMIDQDARCCYLAAMCLAEVRSWEECLNVLGGWDDDDVSRTFLAQLADTRAADGQEVSLHAAIMLLRGRAYDALENRQRAIRWYRAALLADPMCYEAFKLLVENHMLTSKEEFDLVESLSFRPEYGWLHLLYRAKCKKYDQQSTMEATLEALEAPEAAPLAAPRTPADTHMADAAGAVTPEQRGEPADAPAARAGDESEFGVRTRSMAARSGAATPAARPPVARLAQPAAAQRAEPGGCGLAENLDVQTCRADWLQYSGAHQECFRLTSAILERDPYALEVMPVHLTAAVELRKKNELFLRGHWLVEAYPEHAVSWFAVACYYLCTRQHEAARRHFGKATALDPAFAPAWLGFGHSFAFQDESDQAMAAYRTAARLLPGLHTPLLGMGMEYHRMNNLPLAEQLFKQGHAICPADPLLCNELGVLAFRNRAYAEAEAWFAKALDRLPERLTAAWEPTLVNCAHVYRKQRRWAEAEATYVRALSLCPGQASTFVALAYTHHLQGKLQAAILYYHKGLAVRPEDGFAKDMLGLAIQEECEQGLQEL